MLTSAAAGLDELQSAVEVTSCVLLSLNFPVAVNCFVAPIGMLEFAGKTVIDVSVADVIVTDAVPLILPELAVTVAVPAAFAVATPKLLIPRALVADDDQATDGRTCVLPSSKVPVAVNCCSVPIAIVAVEGLTEIDSR